MKRISEFDGLRGLLVTVVVLEHLLKLFAPLSFDPNVRTLTPDLSIAPFTVLHNGGWAVAMFFVLSGYIITHCVFSHSRGVYGLTFMLNRYIKFTLLVAFSYALIYIVSKLGLDLTPELVNENLFYGAGLLNGATPSASELLSIATYETLFLFNYSYNPVLWTLAFEMYGAIVVLLMCSMMRAKILKSSRLQSFIVFASTVCFLQTGLPTNIFVADVLSLFSLGFYIYFLNVRADIGYREKAKTLICIMIGMVIIMHDVRGSIANPLLMLEIPTELFFQRYLLYGLGAGLLMLAILRSNYISRLFAHPLIQKLGKMSFSIYVTHMIVIHTVGSYLHLILPVEGWWLFISIFITLVSIVLVGWVTCELVEIKLYKKLKLSFIGTNGRFKTGELDHNELVIKK